MGTFVTQDTKTESLAIHTQNLCKTYTLGKGAAQVDAVKSLNLEVPRNSIFGFIGPNGAGKTTTIKLLLGLAFPSSGDVDVLGYDIARDGLEIRKRVGYLPQNPQFYEHLTAREILHFKARFFYSGPKSSIEDRVSDMLTLVGLDGKADRPIKGFSGGERQRLGIAQAQVNHPELLILDEPAANLDPVGRRDVLDVMKRLREETTIFYSTHILDDVQQVSDMVAIMDQGNLIAQSSLDEILGLGTHQTYTLVIEGDARAAFTRLDQQEWVSGIHTTHQENQTSWEIHVTDDEKAKSQMLRLVLEDKGIRVIEFSSMKNDLEEAFFNIVRGNQNGES